MDRLPANLFNKFQNMQTLKVVQSLPEIEKKDFVGRKKLKEIFLSQTEFQILKNETFYHCKNLKLLDMQESKLETFEIGAFVGSEKLEILRIKTINRDIFLPLHSITEITIIKSRINQLDDKLFYENRHLKEVSLSGNELKILTETIFINSKLRLLDFDHNDLTEVGRFPTETLRVAHNYLKEIWIMEDYSIVIASYNRIERVICEEFSVIRELYLAMNQMTGFECISDLERLRILNLSNKRLANLTSDTFKKIIYLKHLVLDGNNLFNFDIQWLKSMNFLEGFRVIDC
jgi:Leucine-rich repeat (LRR) protein